MRNKLFRLATSTIVAGVMASIVVNAMPQQAMAAVTETTAMEGFGGFDADTHLTAIDASDNDWRYVEDQGYRDVAIVADGIEGNSLRMSNAVADGNFGNWVYSQRLNTPVTEDADGNQFIAEFKIESETGEYQPGLQISVSPQSDFGDRMSFLRFVDSEGGIDVFFVDNQDDNGIDQRLVQIANDLSRTEPHDVKIVLDLYEGAHNDVANVFIDGNGPLVPGAGAGTFAGFFAPVDHPDTVNKVKAGQSVPMKWRLQTAPPTTWEDYYRFTRTPANTTRSVDSLIFQARDTLPAAPLTDGHGFLFDNVKLSSGDIGTLPQTGGPVDASVYDGPIFTRYEINCADNADMDLLETADAPGASHLTYNEDTGVWHYNWQTTNIMKGHCYRLTLNATGDYALFKIVK